MASSTASLSAATRSAEGTRAKVNGLIAACALAVGCATPHGVQLHTRPQPDHFGPFPTDAAPAVESTTHDATLTRHNQPHDGLIDFVFSGYARFLTKVDGPRCEHRPTCSHYAFLAIKQQGYLLGSLLTIDRLLRGSRSSVLRSLPLYKVEDGVRYYYDPVENNTFWY